ncbi:Uncharacterised protein [Achromobacter sp. 2789STDY5608615]|nr:Uncharacterised protein [Achromobacter sp. 2789STDY5608615]
MAAAALLHVDPAHEMDAGVDAFQRPHEFLVARIARQRQVECLVQLQQAGRVAVLGHVARAFDKRAQRRQLLVGGALAGGAHDAGLEHRAVFIEAVDLLGVQQPRNEAAVHRTGQEALHHQLVEHLAQRRAAHVQAPGQLDFVDAFARLELETHRHRLDGVVQLGLAGHGAGCGSGWRHESVGRLGAPGGDEVHTKVHTLCATTRVCPQDARQQSAPKNLGTGRSDREKTRAPTARGSQDQTPVSSV